MSAHLAVAERAARLAGAIQKRSYGRVGSVRFKGGNRLDPVTEVDHACEEAVRRFLKRRFPSHGFWGEEGGRRHRGADPTYTWLVDPLDGTVNFSHSYPFFCCSVALLKRGDSFPMVGAVYDPLRGELFSAERGKGAHLNGRRLQVSPVANLGDSLLATGFAYAVRETRYNLDNFRRFVLAAQGVRRDGSAALNLCYVAAGRFDGFWERGLQAWDMAAGVLCVREAGGIVTDVTGKPFDLFAGNALASNGRLHSAMREILQKGPDERKWRERLTRRGAPPAGAPEPSPLPLFEKAKDAPRRPRRKAT